MLNGVVTGSLVRDVNLRVVYDAVRHEHPVSRAQLARRLGTTKPMTGRAVDTLLAAGLIREAQAPGGTTAYGAVFFEPCPRAAIVLGLDVGSRFLRGMLSDLDGTVLARIDRPLPEPSAPEVVVARAVELRDALLTRVRADAVDAAAIGIGGVVDPRTGRIQAANLRALDGFAAAEELGAVLGAPVLVDNDVNLAAVGEGAHGAGAGVDDFAYLAVGSGVGAGLVLGGELHRGFHGAAGEVDYVPPGREFQPRSPAADAFLVYAGQRLAQTSGSILAAPLTVEAVFAAARAQDRLAGDLVRAEAARIARYGARLAHVVDLELLVLGGGIGLNGDLLLEPVRAALAELTPYPPRVEVSRLGAGATLTGAVAIALRAVLEDLVPGRVNAPG